VLIITTGTTHRESDLQGSGVEIAEFESRVEETTSQNYDTPVGSSRPIRSKQIAMEQMIRPSRLFAHQPGLTRVVDAGFCSRTTNDRKGLNVKFSIKQRG
jgi:hypothetical protein